MDNSLANSPPRKSLTSLLTNGELGHLERMRLNSRRRLTNRTQGEHLAGKGGNSTEFSDYRDYAPGDDVRYVDWNIFSRLHRPYLKLYQFEEEMHVVLFVDVSTSMLFEDKFLRARQLAAAFGMMGLLNMERVSAYSCREQGAPLTFLPACTGRASMKRLFEFLEGLEGGGVATIDQAVEDVLKRHRGRGIAILLSDFLTFQDLRRPLNLLFSAGLEIFALQVLGPSELDPEVTGDVRLVDSETGETLDISSMSNLLDIYRRQRLALEAQLAQHCRRSNGRFLAIDSSQPLDLILFDGLRRQGWVR